MAQKPDNSELVTFKELLMTNSIEVNTAVNIADRRKQQRGK